MLAQFGLRSSDGSDESDGDTSDESDAPHAAAGSAAAAGPAEMYPTMLDRRETARLLQNVAAEALTDESGEEDNAEAAAAAAAAGGPHAADAPQTHGPVGAAALASRVPGAANKSRALASSAPAAAAAAVAWFDCTPPSTCLREDGASEPASEPEPEAGRSEPAAAPAAGDWAGGPVRAGAAGDCLGGARLRDYVLRRQYGALEKALAEEWAAVTSAAEEADDPVE